MMQLPRLTSRAPAGRQGSLAGTAFHAPYSAMASTSDESLSSGLFFLHLLWAMQPRSVNWSLVAPGRDAEQKLSNARHAPASLSPIIPLAGLCAFSPTSAGAGTPFPPRASSAPPSLCCPRTWSRCGRAVRITAPRRSSSAQVRSNMVTVFIAALLAADDAREPH
jgi:hypothetical protein